MERFSEEFIQLTSLVQNTFLKNYDLDSLSGTVEIADIRLPILSLGIWAVSLIELLKKSLSGDIDHFVGTVNELRSTLKSYTVNLFTVEIGGGLHGFSVRIKKPSTGDEQAGFLYFGKAEKEYFVDIGLTYDNVYSFSEENNKVYVIKQDIQDKDIIDVLKDPVEIKKFLAKALKFSVNKISGK